MGNIELPYEAPWARHSYHLYILRVKDRGVVQEHLEAAGVASGIYYPLPLHYVEPYQHLGYGPGAFPEAERAAQETLAIPLHSEMTEEQIEVVVLSVSRASALAGVRQ